MNADWERDKYIDLSSRYFDRTGRRIDPEKLKAKLEECPIEEGNNF